MDTTLRRGPSLRTGTHLLFVDTSEVPESMSCKVVTEIVKDTEHPVEDVGNDDYTNEVCDVDAERFALVKGLVCGHPLDFGLLPGPVARTGICLSATRLLIQFYSKQSFRRLNYSIRG
jgi:hypothetical protein